MEIWRPIPSYSNYEASNTGRIRSLDRRVWVEQRHRKFWKKIKSRILSLQTDKDGYNVCTLSVNSNNVFCRVSRLVCSAFLGSCPEGMECLHGARGKADDSLSNISWGTKSQNENDKRRDKVSNCIQVTRSDGIEFNSIREAAASVNGSEGYLSDKLNGKYLNRWAYGFNWSFP